MLQVVTTFWGEASLKAEPPRALVYEEAIYVPFDSENYIANDHKWGLFDNNRMPIEASLYRRRATGERVSGGANFAGDANCRAECNFDYVYLGPFMQHYGHFITATLARCWHPYLHFKNNTRYVLHSEAPIREIFSHSYVSETFARLGLTPENVVRFTDPTRIHRIVVPEPAIEENHFVRPVFGEMGRYIGASLAANDLITTPLYLSKLRLPAGVGKFLNEEAFVEALTKQGFKIVYPECMSLSEQIKMFNSCKFVVGSGSNLHTALFCSRPPLLISLALTDWVNSNLTLIDFAAGTQTLHILPEEGTRWNHHPDNFETFLAFMRGAKSMSLNSNEGSGFMSLAEIPEPDNFAKQLADLLRSQGAFT